MIYRVCSSLLESCVVIRAVFFQHTLGSQQQRDFMNTQPGMIAALANQSMVIAHHEVRHENSIAICDHCFEGLYTSVIYDFSLRNWLLCKSLLARESSCGDAVDNSSSIRFIR